MDMRSPQHRPTPFFFIPVAVACLVLAITASPVLAVDSQHTNEAPHVLLHSADGRYIIRAHCNGWLHKYVQGSSTAMASIRVGERIHTLAFSADERYLAVANAIPQTLVLLNSDLAPRNTLPITSHDGQQSSHVSAIYPAAPRQGFVVLLHEIPELWEISTDPAAPDIPTGFIHDHRMREGSFIPGYLNPRRTRLTRLYPQHTFNQDYSLLKMATPQGSGQVVSLDARKRIADLPLLDHPYLGEEIVWQAPSEPLHPCTL